MIDADSVIVVCERYSAIEWNKKVAPASWADAYESFAEEIDSQPTAYDVEAVVRELEELFNTYLENVLIQREGRHYVNTMHIFEKAIEIVNRGGRNERPD